MKKTLAFLFCLLILSIHCSHCLAYKEIALLRVIALITKRASCQVNYFSPEPLPSGEMRNWKKKMYVLIVCIREIMAASSPQSREKIHSMGSFCKKEKGSPPLSCSCLGLHLAFSLSLSGMIISGLTPKTRKSWTEKPKQRIWLPSSILWGHLCIQLLVPLMFAMKIS